jgi:hypothetical protein
MFNNALDHSNARNVTLSLKRTAASTEMQLLDDGVGIFRKIQAALNLIDERHSVLELAKGKFTTNPDNHTGKGIFFTSRVLDQFNILSGGVYFSHEYGDDEDWILENENPNVGTAVFMRLHNHTARTTRSIFDQYTSEDTLAYEDRCSSQTRSVRRRKPLVSISSQATIGQNRSFSHCNL